MKKRFWRFVFLFMCVLPLGADTIVRFETTLGAFDVQLYDRAGPTRSTPLTVANFLAYVEDGSYTNMFFHRSVPGFVVQGGGFTIDGLNISAVPSKPAVQNEPGNSNIRGTIAMAKIGGDPNSATSQWFFNMEDNSAILDGQNGGFTVFGHVLGDGMDVIDALSGITVYDASPQLGGVFNELPLLNPVLSPENLLMLTRVEVIPFEFTEQIQTESGMTLRWSGAGERPVNIQRATNLVTTDWQTIASGIISGEFTDPSPPDDGPVFYRVVKL